MDHDGQSDVLVEAVERGNEEEEKNLSATVSDEEIDDSIRKILTVSATSLALAGTIMSWLNPYLGKPLPNGGSRDNANLLGAQQQEVAFKISPENLQILFICIGSSGIGILISVAFIAYHISLVVRKMKSSAEASRSPEHFKRMLLWSLRCQIFLFFGVVLGFVSVAVAVILFHNFSLKPFFSFLLPLVFFAVLAAIAFCKLN